MKKLSSTHHFTKILLLAITFSLCLLTQTSCVQKQEAKFVHVPDVVVHSSLSENARLVPQWVEPRGVGIGFIFPDERDMPPDQRTQSEEIYLNENGGFDILLLLQSPEITNALITIILDYQQVEFELDGAYGLLHEIPLSPGSDYEIPIKVDVSGVGQHDLIVAAFIDPYNASIDPMYRSESGQRLVGRRAVLVVGDSAEDFSSLLPISLTGTPFPDDVTFGFRAAFAKPVSSLFESHPSKSSSQLYVGEGKTDSVFPYRIWISNFNGEVGFNYAVILFHNFHQVPINDEMVLVTHLLPGEELIIDTSLQLPSQQSVEILQLVYIFDPYRSILRDEVLVPIVFGSFRIAIDVNN
jgi:hypothetical protein